MIPLLQHCKHSHGVRVTVHPTDPTRLELIIPGEQHFYVRAVNAAERQRWLVALGSSKAGTLDGHKHKGTLVCSLLPCFETPRWTQTLVNILKEFQKSKWTQQICPSAEAILLVPAGPDGLKTKMSELRLYCDLLVQQVQTIQTQFTADAEATPSVEVAHLPPK